MVDPPYYDAIQYGDLSDFFFVWLKRSVGELYPDIFSTPLTPKKQRSSRIEPADINGRPCRRTVLIRVFRSALVEIDRVLRKTGSLTLVFSRTVDA